MKASNPWIKAALLACACAAAGAQDRSVAVLRDTELRADKLPSAAVMQSLRKGAQVTPLSLEGGWAWVETAGVRGWVRAGTLDIGTQASAVSALPSAREAAGARIATLGIRSLPPRVGRHALIVTVGKYADDNIAALPGTTADVDSARQMAQAMQIPPENIRYLRDEQATGDAIRNALRELDRRVMEGDRVYVHFSGHGTRWLEPSAGGCVEALLAHDGGRSGTLTNHEMAELLAPISRKTDKMFVMYDACHSGGVLGASRASLTRSISMASDEGRLRPKYTPGSDECERPVNVKTRNLVVEAQDKGTLPQDIVHLSSSRDNEISFDDEQKGGLATQFMRDCMLRDAKDLDGSGAISIEEIRMCAQDKMNKRMQNDSRFKPSNITLSGNASFVPAWFAAAQLAPTPVAAVPVALPVPTPPAAGPNAARPPIGGPIAPTPPQPVAVVQPPAAPKPLTGQEALKQLFDQRDAKRRVLVRTAHDRLQINRDYLEFAVESDRKGFVYVAMAGSDNQSVYVLFPNDLDKNNAIEPGKPLVLPRADWRIKAGGPAGTNDLLVLVADSPRDLAGLPASKAGAFLKSLNNAEGRAGMGALMTRARAAGSAECSAANRAKNPGECSDAFGAAMFKVVEESQ